MDFAAALDTLYETFKAPVPRRIDGCPCCIDRKEVQRMHVVPLRELTAKDLGSYAASLFLTVGDVQDFRYFLPRIFEISATDASWWPSPEVVLGKLALAGWLAWPTDERRAIVTFIGHWFDRACALELADEWESPVELDELLCGIGRAGLDTTPYLNKLLRFPAILRAYNRGNAQHVADKGKLANGFWDGHASEAARVIAFLQSPTVEAILKDSHA